MQESRTERKSLKSSMGITSTGDCNSGGGGGGGGSGGFSSQSSHAGSSSSVPPPGVTASGSSHRLTPYTSALSSQLSLAHG